MNAIKGAAAARGQWLVINQLRARRTNTMAMHGTIPRVPMPSGAHALHAQWPDIKSLVHSGRPGRIFYYIFDYLAV